MSIEIKGICKKFRGFTALDGINLRVESGELLALLGPSGSGKTTLLRIIAGLEFADSGSVLLHGEEAQNKHVRDRNVGFVFQHYALFRHMTVFENVAFGLRVRPKKHRPSHYQINRMVLELLQRVHLDSFYDRYPHQLSGGQRQRVALARALAVKPKVLLLDEPFGALDAKVRKELRHWIRRLHDEIPVTTVFVTHDQEEAMEVADRLVILNRGRVEQVGTPSEVWREPVNSFVYDFLGNYNEFEGWKDEQGEVHLAEVDVVEAPAEPLILPRPGWLSRYPEIGSLMNKIVPSSTPRTPEPAFTIRQTRVQRPAGAKPVKLYARPFEMEVSKTATGGGEYVAAIVTHLNPAGALVNLEFERSDGSILQVELPQELAEELQIRKGDQLYLRPKETKVFDE